MATTNDRPQGPSTDARPAVREAVAPAAPADHAAPAASPPAAPPQPPEVKRSHRWRKWLLLAVAVAGLAAGGYYLAPTVETMLNTVSTDDAYVNGHVTLVAPRVGGQV